MNENPNKEAVIVFSTAYLPLIGGAELAIKEITDRIHDVDFFLVTCRMRKTYPRIERIGNVMVYRVGFGIPIVDKIMSPLLGMVRVRTLIRSGMRVRLFWSVMVSFTSLTPFFLRLAHMYRNIPIVLTLQEGDSEEHIRHARGGLIGMSWRFALKHASRVHVISAHLLYLARYYGYQQHVEVIPNGVDMNTFSFRGFSHEPSYRVVTTSRLVEKNGVDILIRAVAEVHAADNRVTCHIAGDGPKRKQLTRLAHELGISDAIVFMGTVPFASIPHILNEADVFVRPSRSEGLGTSFLEAMAVGVPVVATRVGGIEDFLEDEETGLFAQVDDAHDVAEKIQKIFSDEKLRNHLIESAHKRVQESFSWDTVATKMNHLFHSV